MPCLRDPWLCAIRSTDEEKWFKTEIIIGRCGKFGLDCMRRNPPDHVSGALPNGTWHEEEKFSLPILFGHRDEYLVLNSSSRRP